MLVALIGNGIFRTTDEGRLWQPASIGQRSAAIVEILLSPGLCPGSDGLFQARFVDEGGGLYRSTDGGATWMQLKADLDKIALSPEFHQDGVLMGLGWDHVRW